MKKPPQITPIDEHVLVLTDDEFEKFKKALAAAPSTIDAINALRKRPSPWRK